MWTQPRWELASQDRRGQGHKGTCNEIAARNAQPDSREPDHRFGSEFSYPPKLEGKRIILNCIALVK